MLFLQVKDCMNQFDSCTIMRNICNTNFYSYKISNPVANEIIFFYLETLINPSISSFNSSF